MVKKTTLNTDSARRLGAIHRIEPYRFLKTSCRVNDKVENRLQGLINDSRLRWLLLVSFLIQLIYCIAQVGFFHPDQHFQLIEFSSWQLGEPSGATSVWEFSSHIRPTLQIYLFSGFVEVCRFFWINDAYTQLTILQVIFGLFGFFVFNAIAIYYFKANRDILYIVLLLLNLSWTLPYIRTLFTSEMASSVTFFGTILLYQVKKEKLLYVFLTGFLFSLTFYFRFQLAFGVIGFGLWLLFIEKKYAHLVPMAIGFLVGVGINVLLDYTFYHQLVFTPYDYFRVNITEGKAASFGTSSFVWYILMLALVIGAPPISIFFFYYSAKGAIKHYRQPLVFAVVFFVIGHCLVGHKEERFLFPVLNVLPILAGWGIASFMDYFQQAKKSIQLSIKGVFYISVALNTFILVMLPILNPYYQTVAFGRKLANTFEDNNSTIYCLSRTPFETENHLPLTFYRRNAPNIKLVRFTDPDSVRYLKNTWLATTFNDAKDKFPLLDSLGFKPQLYSSTILWNTNEYLASKKANTINEIWVLYKKE